MQLNAGTEAATKAGNSSGVQWPAGEKETERRKERDGGRERVREKAKGSRVTWFGRNRRICRMLARALHCRKQKRQRRSAWPPLAPPLGLGAAAAAVVSATAAAAGCIVRTEGGSGRA